MKLKVKDPFQMLLTLSLLAVNWLSIFIVFIFIYLIGQFRLFLAKNPEYHCELLEKNTSEFLLYQEKIREGVD